MAIRVTSATSPAYVPTLSAGRPMKMVREAVSQALRVAVASLPPDTITRLRSVDVLTDPDREWIAEQSP